MSRAPQEGPPIDSRTRRSIPLAPCANDANDRVQPVRPHSMYPLSSVPSRLLADEGRALPSILAAGVALRLLVFYFLAPFNNDPHWEFIEFVVEHRRLPVATEITLGFHPPLYFLLVAPLLALTGSAKVVQLFSLACSLANLLLIYGFVRGTVLLDTARGRAHALMLAAFLPQFVLFSSFVSNDALAYLIGTALLLQSARWIERGDRKNLLLLALGLGLGLLTKGTFLAFAALLAPLVVLVGLRARWSFGRHARALGLFLAVTGLVGGYKFAENTYHFGTPVVTNDHLQQRWMQWQAGTWQGASTLCDVNVAKLVRAPFIGEASRHSIPLLLYGTFWYAHIRESNLHATRHGWLTFFPRAIYAAAVLPSVLMLLGLGAVLWRGRRPVAALFGDEETFRRRANEAVLVAALAGHVALVLAWGLKHDAWSFFQARLLFPAFPTLALLLGWGYERATGRRPRVGDALTLALLLFQVLLLSYLAVEMAAQLAAHHSA